MHRLRTYLPQDRLRAVAKNETLPSRTNGSAIFADISGFTPLTEKLTQTLGPRRGVEELSRQLNDVYSALIDQVENYGGSIISFAGDSIIGWFEEAGPAPASLRAVTCAQCMQSAMRDFTEVSLKIAITTGAARRLVAGDPKIQLMDALAGKTIARLATAERLAHKGEIILDEATLGALGDSAKTGEQRIGAGTSERFTVLSSLINAAEQQVLSALNDDGLSAEGLRPWLLSSVYQREEAGLVSFLTELRPAVPLFTGFSGIDYDTDDDAEEKLNAFVAYAQRVVTKYDGALLQLVIGDKGSYIYSVFGAPTAHEDDAQRAAYAALELKKKPKQLDFIRSIQTGMSLGTLRVGAYGSSTRRTYSALGDDVNLAARLMATATAGEILITGRVQIEVADMFALEPREPISMKGKGEPQPVFAVTGISHHRATRLPEPTYRLPMVGRQDELALVDEKLNLAMQCKGQIVGITAEAGMGKSRLVAEIIRLARKRGFIGYGGACQSSGTNTPYLVWQPIWQAFFDLDLEMPQRKQMRLLEGEIEERSPERVDALPLLGLVLDLPLPDNDFTRALEPKDRKGALEALLEDCLKSAARETPLLIVLDDLHWVDPLSHDLLEILARVSENRPICFVLAYRPPDLVRLQSPRVEQLPYFTKIELNELTATDAEQLIRAKLAQLFPERTGTLPKALAEELTAKSQGNPFFIEELLNYLHDRGLNPYDAKALEELELPASLQTLILSRIDQLTEPQKVTLKVASVIGRVFPFSWLHGYYPSLGDEETIKANLSVLSRLDLTPLDTPEPELAYLFKHIVTQEVAYESLSYTTRAQLHEFLARYLETTHPVDLPLDSLAFHYSRSENQAKKREYLRKSGEAAQAAYSNKTALAYYEQALALSPEQDELIDLHLNAGTILQLIGKWNEAESHFREAALAAEKYQLTEQIIESQTKLGILLYARGKYALALEWLEKAHTLSSQTYDLMRACEALREIGNVYWRQGNFDTARQFSQRSLELARQMGDKKKEAYCLLFLATINGQRGNYVESHALFDATLAIAKELNDRRLIASALGNSGTTYYYEGDYTTAKKLFEEGLAAYHEIGDKRGITVTLNNLGNTFYLKSDYQIARKFYNESLTYARESGDRLNISIALGSLGITSFQQKKFAEASVFFQDSLRLNRELGDKVGLALVHCYLGLLALAQNQTNAARESFREGLTIAHQSAIKSYVIYNLIGMACVFLAKDNPSHAVILLGTATANAKAIGFKIEPELQRPYDVTLSVSKEKTSEADFQSAWDEGQKMTLEQAVQFALEVKDPQ